MDSDRYIEVARDMIDKLETTVTELKEEIKQLKADKEAWHDARRKYCARCDDDGCRCGRPRP